MTTSPALRERIKEIIIDTLSLQGMSPEMIGDDLILFGGEGLALDSVDALELVVVLEKEFGFRIESQQIKPEAFATVNSIAQMVQDLRAATAAQ